MVFDGTFELFITFYNIIYNILHLFKMLSQNWTAFPRPEFLYSAHRSESWSELHENKQVPKKKHFLYSECNTKY